MSTNRMNRVRIEHLKQGKEVIQVISYLATGKWNGPTGNHVMAILTVEWGVETGDRIVVYMNGIEVDALDC